MWFEVQDYGLVVNELPQSYQELADAIYVLANAHRGTALAIGDCLLVCEENYPDKLGQAAEESGFSPSYLQNLMWICRRIPPANRIGIPIRTLAVVAAINDDNERQGVLDKIHNGLLPKASDELRALTSGLRSQQSTSVSLKMIVMELLLAIDNGKDIELLIQELRKKINYVTKQLN